MKLLRVVASNFKNCCDNFTIDFVAKSRKTSEDKEYELQAIADDLHAFNTVAFVGKNASGKTTAVAHEFRTQTSPSIQAQKRPVTPRN